jgi:hypothetical protein
MNVPRIDQITLSVDIAHLRVSGFILHAGALDRQRSARNAVEADSIETIDRETFRRRGTGSVLL